MHRSVLGFDEAFDRTGADTRAQAGSRALIGVMVFATGLTAIPVPALLIWAAMFATGDSALWIATDPANQATRPTFFRAMRLAATLLSTCAWVTIGSLWWGSPGDYTKAVGVALIAGILLYVVRGCHRSLVQMMATGLPPALALLYLPFTGQTLTAQIGLFGSLALLVAYAVSSGHNAWRGHRRLEAATVALIEKQREAEAASVAKSEFLANMSHEIRTPLNGVLAMAHVLEQADLPDREREAASLICASGETLQRLLSDILDLAKVEAGQMEVEAVPFHAGELVRSVAALCRIRADEKGVRLTVDVNPAAETTVVGDAVRVRQVVSNLLANAVKFTAAGEVRLVMDRDPDGRLRVAVSDTGVGFDPAIKARLFDRFQQADGSITRRFGGSGLGLAISRGLVEMMGGALDCDSEPGVGSTFWFTLNLPTAAEAPAQVDADVACPPTRALRVLVADDNPTNLKVVQIILAGSAIVTATAEDGLQAIQAHEAECFDLILMDMQMPVMDGLTAVTRIRAAEFRTGSPRTPIIMLTANASPEHIKSGQMAGADGHLTKPITPASLFQAITEATADRPFPAVASAA